MSNSKKSTKKLQPVPSIDVEPLMQRVIVKPEVTESKTAGGIIIPDSAKRRTNKGLIVSAGDLSTDQLKKQVVPGVVVLYDLTAGTEITINGESYLIMTEDRLLAILN